MEKHQHVTTSSQGLARKWAFKGPERRKKGGLGTKGGRSRLQAWDVERGRFWVWEI
jgi:hypothetical protein